MNSKGEVLILIEHVARELESAVLVKYFMEKKGYSVIIDSIKFHKESKVLKYNPDIVIVPWAYSNKEVDLFRSFLRENKKVIILNMHHEQLSNEGSDSFIIPQEDAKEILHLSWGSNFSEKLLQNGCDEKTIIQVGNPRLDFYKNKLIKISKSKSELAINNGLDETKKWILFIANSFHLLTPNQIKINLDKGVDIEDQIEASIKNREEFLKYVDKYLSENDDVEFIYRPHPSFAHIDENREEIVSLEKKYKNFKCISKNSIRDWIINSELSISFHSTSVIECCISGNEFYLMRKFYLKENKDYKFFRDYEYTIKNYNDFKLAIEGNTMFNYNKFKNDIKDDIDLNIDIFSAKLIAEKLDYMYSNLEKYYTHINFKHNTHIKVILYSLIKKLIYKLSKFKAIENYMINKNDIRLYNLLYKGNDYFELKDIQCIQEIIENTLN